MKAIEIFSLILWLFWFFAYLVLVWKSRVNNEISYLKIVFPIAILFNALWPKETWSLRKKILIAYPILLLVSISTFQIKEQIHNKKQRAAYVSSYVIPVS